MIVWRQQQNMPNSNAKHHKGETEAYIAQAEKAFQHKSDHHNTTTTTHHKKLTKRKIRLAGTEKYNKPNKRGAMNSRESADSKKYDCFHICIVYRCV